MFRTQSGGIDCSHGADDGLDDLRILTDILAPRALAEDEATAVHPQYDTSRTQSRLAGTSIECPRPDTQLFNTYLNYLRRMKLDRVGRSPGRGSLEVGGVVTRSSRAAT